MRLSGIKLWALVLASVFLGSVAAASVNVGEKPNSNSGPTPTAGTSPRTVLMEVFTSTSCPPCALVDPAVGRIADEYPRDKLVVIAYHTNWPSPVDPFYDASIQGARVPYYGVNGVPALIVDGGGLGSTSVLWQSGAYNPISANYAPIRQDIDSEKAVMTNITISLSGDLAPGSATVTATLYASDPVGLGSLNTRMVLYTDPLYYMGTNTEPFHRFVARAYYSEALMISQGQTISTTHSFTLNPGWDMNRMGVVVFVQSDVKKSWTSGGFTYYNAPVLQSAQLRYVMPNTLLMMDAGTTADYTEYFEKPLSNDNRAFETYNTLESVGETGTVDLKTDPGIVDLQEYGAVIWNTAGETLGTLTAGNKATLGAYLDSPDVGGNLFVTGRAIASELGASDTFLSTYLHSTFSGGTSIATYINGVTGDPISNSYAAFNLPIVGSPTAPSDVIDPGLVASTTFTYPGPQSAAIRSDHDLDSKVVYLGANYFGGTDTVARKTDVIKNILNWLDSIAGPKVSVITPNGGEQYTPGETVMIKWKAIDVEIPVDGIDIYFTTDLTTPTWSLVSGSEPNDGVYTWTVPSVQTSDCGIKIVTRDGDMMTPDGVAISAGPCTIGSPDVAITKTVSNPTPQVGEAITYTITLTNVGSATGYATVTDALPALVTYVSDDGDLTGVSNYFPSNTTVAWTVAVPGLSSVSMNIVVTVNLGPAGTTIENFAFFNSTNSAGGSSQAGNSEANFQIPSLELWQLDLLVGKHLISIPLQLIDYRVEVALATLAGKYDYVREFDARDSVSPWKSYVPGRAYNTLTHLNLGTSFWIYINTPGSIIVTGAKAPTTNIDLVAGWNLVGYPSLQTTYTVADMKASLPAGVIVEGFDINSPPYNLWILPSTYTLKAGEGYWVYVPSAATWSVTG